MFFDIEITEELFNVPHNPPRLTRQYGCSNLVALSKQVLSIDTEINFDEHIFRSAPNFYDLSNSSNQGTNNLPQLKRYNSDSKQLVKSPSLKRINTF